MKLKKYGNLIQKIYLILELAIRWSTFKLDITENDQNILY